MSKRLYMSLIFSNLVVLKKISSNHRMYNLYTKFVKIRKRIRDASIYTSKKISLKFLFLSDIFLFPFIRQQVTVLA